MLVIILCLYQIILPGLWQSCVCPCSGWSKLSVNFSCSGTVGHSECNDLNNHSIKQAECSSVLLGILLLCRNDSLFMRIDQMWRTFWCALHYLFCKIHVQLPFEFYLKCLWFRKFKCSLVRVQRKILFKAQTLRVLFCLKKCIVILCSVKTNAYSVIYSENACFSHNRQGEEELKRKYSQWHICREILIKSPTYIIDIIYAFH